MITFSLLFGFFARFLVVASPPLVLRRVVGVLVGAATAGWAGGYLLTVGAVAVRCCFRWSLVSSYRSSRSLTSAARATSVVGQ